MITYSHNSNCITPQMTAADVPSPVVVTESSCWNLDFAGWCIFDQIISGSNYIWSANARTFPQWIKIYLGTVGSSITGYTLSARGDEESYMTTPSEWKLYGSVDDIDWVELDHQTGIIDWESSEMRTFSLDSPTASYNYFKFEVLDSEGFYSPAIGELELLYEMSLPTGNLVSSLEGISSEFVLEQEEEELEFTGNLVSSLEGISSEFVLGQDEFFSKIKIEFSLAKKTFDDIPFICEWQKMSWESIACEFSFENYDYYQYAYMTVLFQIIQGSYFSDVPVIFSVIRKLQSFAFYIMQKLYCTCVEINGGVGLDLEDWNVSPNKTWFVHVNNDLVTLYNTEVDMIAGINAIMSGYADATTFKVVLLYVDDERIVDFYYQDLIYHLSLTAIVASDRYFRVKPLTDLAEIRHPVYNNSNIVLSRGEAELNLHTYAILGKELVLATHIPELESGDSIEYNSVVRGTIKKTQILSHTISGEQNNDGTAILINTIRVAEYKELTR